MATPWGRGAQDAGEAVNVQAGWWGAAVAMLVLAAAAAAGERRRHRRDDPDAVGWIDWPSVQVGALVGAMICAGIAFRV